MTDAPPTTPALPTDTTGASGIACSALLAASLRYQDDYATIIYCGDNRKLVPLLQDESFDAVITSPPYNMQDGTGTMGHAKSTWQKCRLSKGYETHADDMPQDQYETWQRELLLELWKKLTPMGAIFYNHKPRPRNGQVWLPLTMNPRTPPAANRNLETRRRSEPLSPSLPAHARMDNDLCERSVATDRAWSRKLRRRMGDSARNRARTPGTIPDGHTTENTHEHGGAHRARPAHGQRNDARRSEGAGKKSSGNRSERTLLQNRRGEAAPRDAPLCGQQGDMRPVATPQ